MTRIEASSVQICKYCRRVWKPESLWCFQGQLSHHSLSLCISCSYVLCWHWLGGAVLQLAAVCLQIQIPRLPLQVCQAGALQPLPSWPLWYSYTTVALLAHLAGNTLLKMLHWFLRVAIFVDKVSRNNSISWVSWFFNLAKGKDCGTLHTIACYKILLFS